MPAVEPGRKAPPPSAFGVNAKDQEWVKSKLTDQPNGVAFQPIKLTGARERARAIRLGRELAETRAGRT